MRPFLLRLLERQSRLWVLVLFLSMLPVLRWVAAILVALATLRFGAKIGGRLVVAMALPFLLLLLFDRGVLIPVLSQLIEILLLFGLALLLRSTQSWLLLLQSISVGGLILVTLVHWLNPEIASSWAHFLKPEFELLSNTLFKHISVMVTVDNEDQTLLLDSLARFATGLEILVLSASALFNLAFGRYLQATLYNPGGLKRELYALRLSPVFASLLVGLLIVTLWTQQVVLLDYLAVVVLPLVITGFSLLHCLTARFSWQSLWLVFCYIALVLFPPQVLVLLIGASFVDAWWNIRQRFMR